MTVDLLPSPSSQAAPPPDRASDRATASGDLRGDRHGWAHVEQDCPYCFGPETD